MKYISIAKFCKYQILKKRILRLSWFPPFHKNDKGKIKLTNRHNMIRSPEKFSWGSIQFLASLAITNIRRLRPQKRTRDDRKVHSRRNRDCHRQANFPFFCLRVRRSSLSPLFRFFDSHKVEREISSCVDSSRWWNNNDYFLTESSSIAN